MAKLTTDSLTAEERRELLKYDVAGFEPRQNSQQLEDDFMFHCGMREEQAGTAVGNVMRRDELGEFIETDLPIIDLVDEENI